MAIQKWKALAPVDVMTTDIAGLANNAGATSSVYGGSGVIDNTQGVAAFDGFPWCDLFLVMPTGVTFVGGILKLWWLRAWDVSTPAFETVTSGAAGPLREPDAVFFVNPGDSLQSIAAVAGNNDARSVEAVRAPTGKARIRVYSDGLGAAIPASSKLWYKPKTIELP